MTALVPDVVQILPPDAPREQWLAVRRQGLGGTDIAALFGVNPYTTKLGVYLDKVYGDDVSASPEGDDDDGTDDSPSEAAYWGTVLEAPVAEHFARTVARGQILRQVGTWARGMDGDRWAIATPDRLIFDGDDDQTSPLWLPGLGSPRALYEGKTASVYLEDGWKGGQVPDQYVLQVQWYLYVMGLERAHIAALLGGQRFVHAEIERDQELIDGITSVAARFWYDNVLAYNPPSLEGEPTKAALALLDRMYPVSIEGERVDLPDEYAALLAEHEQCKAEERRAKKAAEALKVRIREAMGPAEVAYIAGEKAATLTSIAGSTYEVTRKPSRRLNIAKGYKPA